jgi:alpha-beta hydrolase superfamily lysophospholipase
MRHYSRNFNTRDGTEIFHQAWLPDEAAKGTLQIVHGLGEHSGRYRNYVDYFVPKGYALYAADMRGHGRSGGPRGHTPDYDTLLDDIAAFLAHVRDEQIERKIVLLGHSLGGNLALNYALRRPEGPAAVIVTGPWLQLPKAPPAPLVALARVMGRVAPAFALANGLDVAGISRDPAVVVAYTQDPLVHDRISTRMYLDCAAAATWALKHAGSLALPALLLHGGDDRLTSPNGTRLFWHTANNPQVEHREYAGMYHEIHNDVGKEAVFKDIADWLSTKL